MNYKRATVRIGGGVCLIILLVQVAAFMGLLDLKLTNTQLIVTIFGLLVWVQAEFDWYHNG